MPDDATPAPLDGLRAAIREVLVAWERYFDSETDEGRRVGGNGKRPTEYAPQLELFG
jgi:hypothetical protein